MPQVNELSWFFNVLSLIPHLSFLLISIFFLVPLSSNLYLFTVYNPSFNTLI